MSESRSNWERLWALAVLALFGCSESYLVQPGGPQGSTETGNPPVLDRGAVSLVMSGGEVHVVGAADAVTPPEGSVEVTAVATGETFTSQVNADGSFDVRVEGAPGDAFEVSVVHGDQRSLAVTVALVEVDAGRPPSIQQDPAAHEPEEMTDPPPPSTEQERIDARFYPRPCELPRADEPRTLTVPTDYASIQEAIDAAEPYDTVSVLPGVYREHVRLRSGVRLVGSGADTTILDGGGEGKNLVDFTDAYGVRLSGFTLRNVGQAEGCGRPSDVQACSGDWYSAAIYADGHSVFNDDDPCNNATITLTDNLIINNEIGMMVYHGPHATVRSSVFAHNAAAFVASAHQATSHVEDNVFYSNDLAISAYASYLDIVDNAFERNVVVLDQEYIQQGDVSCNVLWANDSAGERMMLGAHGNREADPLVADPEGFDFGLAADSPVSTCPADD